jgi:hypothetical protein
MRLEMREHVSAARAELEQAGAPARALWTGEPCIFVA